MLSPSRTGGLGLLVLLSPFSKKGLGLGLGLKSDALSNRDRTEIKGCLKLRDGGVNLTPKYENHSLPPLFTILRTLSGGSALYPL